MNEVIHIVLASNESYYLGLFVTSVSLARHAREDLTLVFHVFDGGISDALFATYSESLSRAHAHVSVDRIRIDEDLFSKCPDFRGNKMAYARLLGPKMFLDVVWAVYCDVDVLWRADVAELVDQCKGSNASLWAVHVGLSKGNVESFEAQGLKVNPDRYFNSGVMVMNFDRLRTGDFMGEVVSILARHPELGLAEQNALNVLYSTKSSLEILDDSWNVRMFAVKNHAEIRCAKVLHYVASAPWNRGLWAYPFSPGSLQWFKELSRIKGVGLIRCACEVLTIWCLLSKLILTGVDRIPLLRKVPRWIRGG